MCTVIKELKQKCRNINVLDEIYDALKAEKDVISQQNEDLRRDSGYPKISVMKRLGWK